MCKFPEAREEGRAIRRCFHAAIIVDLLANTTEHAIPMKPNIGAHDVHT